MITKPGYDYTTHPLGVRPAAPSSLHAGNELDYALTTWMPWRRVRRVRPVDLGACRCHSDDCRCVVNAPAGMRPLS